MDRIEAVRAAHEISRTLGRAADSARLDYALRLHTHLVHGIDNALGNRVMAATGAQRCLPAAIIQNGQADAVGLGRRSAGRSSRHVISPPCSSGRPAQSTRPAAIPGWAQ